MLYARERLAACSTAKRCCCGSSCLVGAGARSVVLVLIRSAVVMLSARAVWRLPSDLLAKRTEDRTIFRIHREVSV